MDAFGIMRILLLLSWTVISRTQELQETSTAPAPEVIIENTTVELSTITVPPVNYCLTARGLPGMCVIRQNCDFGTAAIDRTLYAPKGYKKPCADEEACCPNEFIVIPAPTDKSQNDDLDMED